MEFTPYLLAEYMDTLHSPWLVLLALAVLFSLPILVYRRLQKIPAPVFFFVTLVGAGLVLSSMLYNRNEPEILTPLIDFVAQWFPDRNTRVQL
ncbi:MAG: hypothetical protein EA425_03235 [Puniceicoccaceae bacterium]|nr:MAG: hypothetical protein EA425_03235 [Puniceicoccaceae bacterium]